MGDSDTSFTESLGRSDPIAPSLRRIRMESSGYRIVDLHRVRPLGNLLIPLWGVKPKTYARLGYKVCCIAMGHRLPVN